MNPETNLDQPDKALKAQEIIWPKKTGADNVYKQMKDETLVCEHPDCDYEAPWVEFRKKHRITSCCPECLKAGRETGEPGKSLVTETYLRAKEEGKADEYQRGEYPKHI